MPEYDTSFALEIKCKPGIKVQAMDEFMLAGNKFMLDPNNHADKDTFVRILDVVQALMEGSPCPLTNFSWSNVMRMRSVLQAEGWEKDGTCHLRLVFDGKPFARKIDFDGMKKLEFLKL